MTKPLEWPDSPAPTDRDIEGLQKKWKEVLSHYQSHLAPSAGEQRPSEEGPTIYEWLQQNSDTTELVRYLERVSSVRDMLQDGQSTHTIWAPTNSALARFTQDDSELELLLQYHMTPHEMPLLRILDTPNIPTLARPAALNGMLPLRLRSSPRGIRVNGQTLISKTDVRVKNGVVHLVDRVLFIPPRVADLISSPPEGQFSRLRQALQITGLAAELASSKFVGCTFFIPNDAAFANLGREVEAFLQSPEGNPYLRALLQYHIAPKETLYSNMFYHGDNEKGTTCPPIGHKPHASTAIQTPASVTSLSTEAKAANPSPPKQPGNDAVPLKGKRTFPLPTMLGSAWMHVEIARYGGVISMFVREGQASVVIQDIIAFDGIAHVVDSVLLPSLHSLSPTSEHDTKNSASPASILDVEQLKAVLGSHM